MLKNLKSSQTKKAQSVMEFVGLIIFVMGAFLVMQRFIHRALMGQWKSVGDYWGQGMVYDPDGSVTLDCKYDQEFTQLWYNVLCYKEKNCDRPCYYHVKKQKCIDCITECSPDKCHEDAGGADIIATQDDDGNVSVQQ